MCGISGVWMTDSRADAPEWEACVESMMELMVRRGPDDRGQWSDRRHCRLGFRRLSILDLSPAGHQPMVSADGRSAIVFNGEMYNFQDLRAELESSGVRFRSRSDTEVVLEALNRWGVDALARFNGMFALAWYDLTSKKLLLARDHAGIKPLYYAIDPLKRGVLFASQFNCLLRSPWGVHDKVRQDVLRLYLRIHYIPAPYTLFESIHQLEPGHFLLVNADGSFIKRAWWTLPLDPEPSLPADQGLEALAAALENAVRRQRISDVPLGVYLSGGVDSPLITAIARKQTDSSLKAFTIGNPGWAQDEAGDAAAFARTLDVDHRLTNVTGQDALALVPEVSATQPEPFADFSIVPSMLVSRIAKQEVTVALSGDGGDELFFGYTRPLSLMRNGTDFRYPPTVRKALYALGKLGAGPKRSDVVLFPTPGDYYFDVNCRVKDQDLARIAPGLEGIPADFNLYRSEPYRNKRQLASFSRYVEFYGQLQRCLKKVDMASMHYSLEVRVPILDREVIETSLRMDPFDSMAGGVSKATLRQLLRRYVPANLISSAKRGFAVPLKDWLAGPLRSHTEDVLFGGTLFPEGLFDQREIRKIWNDQLAGRRDFKWGIWTLLMLQQWHSSIQAIPKPEYAAPDIVHHS